jgi:GMP synthase (glutamine-hydrolysing)
MRKLDLILILDFGSQYTQLIARRLRELKVYCEIQPFSTDLKEYWKEKSTAYNVKGVILSGGPASVLEKNSPRISRAFLDELRESGIPILGICYGLQLLCDIFGGKLHIAKERQYGNTPLNFSEEGLLFKAVPRSIVVWMSHGDSIDKLPAGFRITSKSNSGVVCSFSHKSGLIYGLQFHPEVEHTQYGRKIISNFAFGICKVKNKFKPASFIESKVKEIRETANGRKVICALSGGVDSSVAAVLAAKAIGKDLICIHIDNGLMRKDESRKVVELFRRNYRINLDFVDASELFLKRLKGVTDPEKKRKIIGKTFIDVFEKEARSIKGAAFLLQGTLYPDVIESVSFKGPSATIKTHHNVGGLPEKMKFKLIEPFRELFKDEVREIGSALGIPDELVYRHPFPGPGLAIRVLSDVNKAKLDLLREADDIYIAQLKKHGLYRKIWQAFAVLLPVQTVGVMGDERSYENVVGLRAVTSVDGMTADFYGFSRKFLSETSSLIINKVKGVNRVVYDISSKPPATIEWE